MNESFEHNIYILNIMMLQHKFSIIIWSMMFWDDDYILSMIFLHFAPQHSASVPLNMDSSLFP